MAISRNIYAYAALLLVIAVAFAGAACVPISLQHCSYAALHIIEMANSETQRF